MIYIIYILLSLLLLLHYYCYCYYYYVQLLLLLLLLLWLLPLLPPTALEATNRQHGQKQKKQSKWQKRPAAQEIQQIKDDYRFFLKLVQFRDLKDRLRNHKFRNSDELLSPHKNPRKKKTTLCSSLSFTRRKHTVRKDTDSLGFLSTQAFCVSRWNISGMALRPLKCAANLGLLHITETQVLRILKFLPPQLYHNSTTYNYRSTKNFLNKPFNLANPVSKWPCSHCSNASAKTSRRSVWAEIGVRM